MSCKLTGSVRCSEPAQEPLLSNEIHNTFIYIYMYNEQNCYNLILYPFSVMTEHAKALYKLRLVLVNAKGSNITSLELPGHCCTNSVGDMFATSSFKRYFSESRKCTTLPQHYYTYTGKLLSIQKVLNTVHGHKRGLAITGDRTLLFTYCNRYMKFQHIWILRNLICIPPPPPFSYLTAVGCQL